jgi:hypothetical protein
MTYSATASSAARSTAPIVADANSSSPQAALGDCTRALPQQNAEILGGLSPRELDALRSTAQRVYRQLRERFGR